MRTGLIAQKLGMTRVFTDEGNHVAVTVLRVANCQVVAQRTQETDGYTALQLGVGAAKVKNVTKPQRGHFAKAKVEPKAKLAEFRVSEDALVDVGAEITAAHFVPGQYVDVTGTSIGKGFAGVMKRHHFGGQPNSHGTERKHRSPGSIASHATWRGQCGKPKKGLRMAGHMGSDQVTTRNHPLVKIDPEQNLLLIKGALPGANGSVVFIRKSITARIRIQEETPAQETKKKK